MIILVTAVAISLTCFVFVWPPLPACSKLPQLWRKKQITGPSATQAGSGRRKLVRKFLMSHDCRNCLHSTDSIQTQLS